jgi:hypothetical protein
MYKAICTPSPKYVLSYQFTHYCAWKYITDLIHEILFGEQRWLTLPFAALRDPMPALHWGPASVVAFRMEWVKLWHKDVWLPIYLEISHNCSLTHFLFNSSSFPLSIHECENYTEDRGFFLLSSALSFSNKTLAHLRPSWINFWDKCVHTYAIMYICDICIIYTQNTVLCI